MITILKKLRSLPMLGLIAAAAVLSVVMGCGGKAINPAANSIVINAATNANVPIGTFAMTIRNNSSKILTAISYTIASSELDSTNTRVLTLTPVTQTLDPVIRPGGSIAAQITYNVPDASEIMTIALTVRDSSGGSQGFNVLISASRTGGTTITPADGTFSYQ